MWYNSNESMSDLLELYSDADVFSLTGSFSSDNTIGDYKLEENEGKQILEELWVHTVEGLKISYNRIHLETKRKLPEFTKLLDEIVQECNNFQKRVDKGNLDSSESPFICDHFFIDTKYNEPNELHHFYSSIGSYNDIFKKTVAALILNKRVRPMDLIFDNIQINPLRNNLIQSKTTFFWHCTTSSRLSIVYYFRLDDNSKSWLLQFKNDFEIRHLEDLAFYKREEILFSCCQHEGFHNHLKK